MKINDLHKYKKSKIIVKDLEKVKELFSKFIKDMMPYTKYSPVQDAFREIHNSMTWTEIHLAHQKRILDSKGTEE